MWWQKSFIRAFLALVLTFSSLAATTGSALAAKEEVLRADPRLLQMAKENPDAIFMVIVQKEARNKNLKDMELEKEVLRGRGRVKKQMDLIVSFSAEMTGKEITKLARHHKVRWISADALMVSTGGPGMDSVSDRFTSVSYQGDDGTQTWSTSWTEGDSSGDSAVSTPDVGTFMVGQNSHCAGGTAFCLMADPRYANRYVYREVNLENAAFAQLSLYRNNPLSGGYDTGKVNLEVSGDGGATWTTLRTYKNTEYTGSAVDTFDISVFAGEHTRIRFYTQSTQSYSRYLYFDDIQIDYAIASAFVSAVHADQLNLDGQGVTVAVVDSGMADRHPDFMTGTTSRVITSTSFGNQDGTFDLYGHGTHVAGILGGSGAASGGKYRGVASGVNLLNLRVSDKDGMTYESSVIDSLQWVYNNRDVYNIRVVNLSLNSSVAQSYHTSPLDAAIEILWFNGITVVVSAGNNGNGEGPVTLYPPANDPFVITVGATEDKGTGNLEDDNLAVFSAYGITDDGFSKPDLVAPGRNLIAPLSDKASTVYTGHPFHRVGDYYFRMSGTSMSAPVVSGAVALLLQAEPNLTPDQIKYRLMATANPDWPGYNASQSGSGYLDVVSVLYNITTESANQGITVSQMLSTGDDPVTWGSVGWNSVGWNSVGWNSVGWNSVGWNSVGWNSVGWNSSIWDD
jgi:serine protease AprX